MSRLQKKCFIGATGFHLLLLSLLIVGPAFLSPGESDPTPVLEFVPIDTTDAKVSGGGTPHPPTPVTTPTPPAAQPQPQPQVQPQSSQPQPQRDPDPPKVEKLKLVKPDPDSLEAKPEKKVHKVQISDTVVKPRDRETPPKAAADTAATAAADAAAKRTAADRVATAQRLAAERLAAASAADAGPTPPSDDR